MIILDDWQQQVLNHKGHLILCTGRQVGKTTIMAIKAAEYMLSNNNSKIIIVSLTEDQAKLIIIMILDYLEKVAKQTICKGNKKPTQNKIILKNGSTALARPVGNTGDAVRGFTGNVLIIDEASRMPELAFTAARPTLMTTAGEIWMCSTPHGKEGYFYESFINKSGRFKVFHISSEEVIRERVISESWTETKRAESIRFLEDEKNTMSELQYGQEYMGLFLDDLRQFFSDELINKVCTEKRPERAKVEGSIFMGCDLARMGGDEITAELLCRNNETRHVRQVESIVKKKQLTTETERMIIEISKLWNPKKIGLDAGAGTLGVSIYDHLMQVDDVKRRLIAMNNRQVVLDRDGKQKQRIFNEDMYDNLKSMMERGEINLLDDMELRISLKSVQWEITRTPSGLSKVHIFGNYTHIAEGIKFAAWLAKKEKGSNIWIVYI